MTLKNKIYLFLSVLTFVLLFLNVSSQLPTVLLFERELPMLWIPLGILLLLLPLLNCFEIIKNVTETNLFYWIGLAFNILSMIFVLRIFKIDIL